MRFKFYTIQNKTGQSQQQSHWNARLWLIAIYIILLLLPLSSLATGSVVLAAPLQPADISSSSYADTVIIMDNINEIKSHDPTGVRFSAAQLFADMAPRGDNIGVVRIPSSSQPTPVQLLDLHPIQTNNDRAIVKSKLSPSQPLFQTVDPGPTAYFAPALQTAGDMLTKLQDGNRKYIILVTDSVALSGDPNSCPESPDQFHHWFCTVRQLESESISVILFGFTTPGPQAQKELQPTKNYINQHGGIVLEVDDGAGVPQVAEQYANLLSRIHPNVFQAILGGKTGSINVDAQDRLTVLTFVALGSPNTLLAQVQLADNVAGKTSDDGTYYNASGAGYWLQTISTGDLAGTWHLSTGTSPPSEILVLGVSDARFQLLNPAPAHSDSDISQRYVVPNERVVLRARVTGVDGNAVAGISFVANPNSDNQVFTTSTIPMSAIPGTSAADVNAILGVAATHSNILHIALGAPLGGGTYLEKQFEIIPKVEMANKWVQVSVPPSKLLKAGDGIPIGAEGTASTLLQSLSIFGRDASSPIWAQVNTGSSAGRTTITGPFPLKRGCGTTYNFIAVEEVSGTLADGSSYDYLAYDESSYVSQLVQSVAGTATLTSDKTLSLWAFWLSSSQVQWNVTFISTICAARDMALGVGLHPDQFSAPVQLNNGGGTFTIAENRSTTKLVTATVGSCPLSSVLSDETDTVQLERLVNLDQGIEFIQAGDWQPTVTCPSFGTFAKGHIWQAFLILFVVSVLVVRGLQLPVLPLLPGTHLKGSVAIVTNAAVLAGEDLPDLRTYMPMTVRIPGTQYAELWYLVRRIESSDTMYTFEKQLSPLALLQFKAQHDASGYRVTVAATRYAIGADLPEFQLTRMPLGQDFVPCEGEPIMIGQDLIYPNLDVVP